MLITEVPLIEIIASALITIITTIILIAVIEKKLKPNLLVYEKKLDIA